MAMVQIRADGIPLNIRLYQVLLEALSDIDKSSIIVNEVDEDINFDILEVIEKKVITELNSTGLTIVNDYRISFKLSLAACQDGTQEICEVIAYKVVFHKLNHVLWDSLYVDEVSSSRIEPFQQELKQDLEKIAENIDNDKFGPSQNADEPCVYLKASGSNVTFLILYVDDILIMGNSIPMLQDVKSYLGKCFAMKDLGEAAYILGIKIYRDRSRRLIGLCQSAYIEKIFKADSHRNSNVEYTPCKDKLRLSNLKVPYTAELKAHCKCSIWPRLGVLLLCCEMYSPDVAFAQTYIADFNRIQLRVSCYTDAGYMTDADDLKSQTGYVFVLNGGAVDWKSAKQSIFATSSAEAEYIMPMMLLRKPFGLGNSFLGSVLDIFVPKVHTLRSLLKFGDIKLENIHIDDNLADPFTKSVSFSNGIQVLTRNIGCFS
ncbi:retrotransposon protein, putative, ty1-copia subclass [Tanacetum coccineum]